MEIAAKLELRECQDRRTAERWTANIAAALKLRALPADPVHVSNISTHGCRFRCRWELRVGARVRVLLPGLEPWWATVSWFSDGQGGLNFDRPLHPTVALRYRAF